MADASVYVSRVRSSCVLPLWESLKPADESNPDSFQITASALGFRACEILCASFKSRIFVCDSPLGPLKASPDGLQNQTFYELIFPVQKHRAEESNVGLRPFTP